MENDQPPKMSGHNGINFDDYYPYSRSYNTVTYCHKKFLAQPEIEKTKTNKRKKNLNKDKTAVKQNKNEHFTIENANRLPLRFELLEKGLYIPILENEARLSENLVPLIIPNIKESSSEPLHYTIKTKKVKKHDLNPCDPREEKDLTYNKDKSKKFDKPKKCKTKNHSAREYYDPLSQNTLDDIHLNINQSSSFSEASGLNCRKRENEKVIKNSSCKYFVSNSFDALATDSINGDCNKVKIHLMNDTNKKRFCESIQNPIVDAIKEYLTHNPNSDDVMNEIKTMKKMLICNSQKLDIVLEKLACLEAKQSTYTVEPNKAEKSPRSRFTCKTSKFEEYGEDHVAVTQDKSSDDDYIEDLEIRKKRILTKNKSVVVVMDNKEKNSGKKDGMECGEELPESFNASSSISQLGVKPERPNRIPARFCWTDVKRIK